jgi:hypothetical protein
MKHPPRRLAWLRTSAVAVALLIGFALTAIPSTQAAYAQPLRPTCPTCGGGLWGG